MGAVRARGAHGYALVTCNKTRPDGAIRERGSSVRGTDQARYANAAGWGQATVLAGPQGFNRGEANSGYVIAYGKSSRVWGVRGTRYMVEGVNGRMEKAGTKSDT